MSAAGEEGAETAAPEPVPVLPEEEFESRRELFNQIFAKCNSDTAKLASINERRNQPVDDEEDEAKKLEREKKNKSLTYGEISMELLHTLLNKVKEGDLATFYPKQGTFLDLGSGAGKACFAAGLLHPFEKVIGVETLQSLHDFANNAQASYQELVPETISKPVFEFAKSDFVVDFDALPVDASTVLMCLAVATCYREDQLQAMANFAKKMPDNSFFICLGQGLPDSCTFAKNRNPLQRRAEIVKRCLAKPGVDPDKVVIDEPEVHAEVGWVEVPWSPMEVQCDWGPGKCFVYFKKPGPFKGEGPWLQLVGLDKEEAQKKLIEARPDLRVELVDKAEWTEVEEKQMERVRICYDSATGQVVDPAPKCE